MVGKGVGGEMNFPPCKVDSHLPDPRVSRSMYCTRAVSLFLQKSSAKA